MSLRELRASSREYLSLATRLLQRARLADPYAGVWEAADVQWWWRVPRASDAIGQLFWLDHDGPVAAAILTDWGDAWGCDPIVVPDASGQLLETVWERASLAIDALGLAVVEVMARDDDVALNELLRLSDFVPAETSGITWMTAEERPGVVPLPSGFVTVDRARTGAGPHPLQRRNGPLVSTRLEECSLYDPALDLGVETHDGEIAGHALFWFDPVTRVGLVEPMRVEEPYLRRGIARALLSEGLDRLARRGARRLKVGYGTEAARNLYVGAGFKPTATATAHRRRRAAES